MVSRRRQANVAGGRPKRRVVRLSASEDAQLSVSAAESGVTVPRFMKEAALAQSSGDTITDRRELITQLMVTQRHLAKVGNNINQIARSVNTDGSLAGDLDGAILDLRGLIRSIDDVLAPLSLDGDE